MSRRLKRSWMMIGASLLVCGCHKKPTPTPQADTSHTELSSASTMPAVATGTIAPAQATTGPSTAPSMQPAFTYLLVGDKLEQFPEARVRVSRNDDQVSVIVYTADPAAAIDNDYQGNSFYFTMPLTEVKDAPGLLTGSWRYKSSTSDYQSTTEGIFIKGLRTQLQSSDVMVRVQQIGVAYQIQIAGQFFAFDTNSLQLPGVLTNVSGEIVATTELRK